MGVLRHMHACAVCIPMEKKTPKDRIVHLASKDLKVTKSQAHTGETGPLGLFVWMYKLVGH